MFACAWDAPVAVLIVILACHLSLIVSSMYADDDGIMRSRSKALAPFSHSHSHSHCLMSVYWTQLVWHIGFVWLRVCGSLGWPGQAGAKSVDGAVGAWTN